MTETPSRRPLASRQTGWAKAAARRLSAGSVTPNRISQASVLFAALGLLLFWASAQGGPGLRGLCLILAALACQARLLCNLLDGMVALEGGKATPDGPFWNEAPDRLADLLFLGGAGLAAGTPALGVTAGALAIACAHLRELGRAEGLPPDFSGPMAKPQRMAVLTAAAVLAAFEPLFWQPMQVLSWALWLILVGTALTILRRSLRMIRLMTGSLH